MMYRAFLFDDEPSILDLVESGLRPRGYEVFRYGSPLQSPLNELKTCICPANSYCADFLISDYAMPGKSGLDFIEELRDKGCKIKHFAMISGSWVEKDILRAENLGCHIIDKPFDLDELIRWLAEKEKTIPENRILCHIPY